VKVFIEAQISDLDRLAETGLLKGARVLARRETKRRRLSRETQRLLEENLDGLRAYKARHGTFDVPRTGENKALGEWLDKLKETFVEAPDGYRIRFLREQAPDVLIYLATWCASKSKRQPVKAAPFWLSAAWAAEFMAKELRAPSQASIQPDEVALAKWLTRWTSSKSLEKLGAASLSYGLACGLDEVAQGLRSRNPVTAAAAAEKIRNWHLGGLYQMVQELFASADEAEKQTVLVVAGAGTREGHVFWPSWTEWRSAQSSWTEARARA
jgi:Helicase associated domain